MNDRHIHTVALTGATGFVGRAALDELTRQGYNIRALTRRHQPAGRQNISWIPGDLSDEAGLEELVSGADAVIHIAGLIKARSRRAFFETNEAGTRRLLAAIERVRRGNPFRFVHVSSLSAREPHLSAYAASKAASEQVLHDAKQGLDWTVLRPSAVYGPGDKETLTFFRMAQNKIVLAPASSTNRIGLIHVEDLARAIAVSLPPSPALKSQTIEVDDEVAKGHSFEEIITMIGAHGNRPHRFINIPRPALVAAGSIVSGLAKLTGRAPMLSAGKAREICHSDWTCAHPRLSSLTDWSASIPAREGLPAVLEWYRASGYL